MEDHNLARIVVVGTTGSGKSTLAANIASALGLRHIELDALFHGPNWAPTPADEFIEKVQQSIAEDGWVVDGNYGVVRDMLWRAADTIVWIDVPLPLILKQLTQRTIRRYIRREVMWGTNREILWTHLLPWDRSLIWWALKTHPRRRKEYLQRMNDPVFGPKMVWLKNHVESGLFVESLKAEGPTQETKNA